MEIQSNFDICQNGWSVNSYCHNVDSIKMNTSVKIIFYTKVADGLSTFHIQGKVTDFLSWTVEMMLLSGKSDKCSPGYCCLNGTNSILFSRNLDEMFPECLLLKNLATQTQPCSILHETVSFWAASQACGGTSAGASRCHLRLDCTCWDAVHGNGFQTGGCRWQPVFNWYCILPVQHVVNCCWPWWLFNVVILTHNSIYSF